MRRGLLLAAVLAVVGVGAAVWSIAENGEELVANQREEQRTKSPAVALHAPPCDIEVADAIAWSTDDVAPMTWQVAFAEPPEAGTGYEYAAASYAADGAVYVPADAHGGTATYSMPSTTASGYGVDYSASSPTLEVASPKPDLDITVFRPERLSPESVTAVCEAMQDVWSSVAVRSQGVSGVLVLSGDREELASFAKALNALDAEEISMDVQPVEVGDKPSKFAYAMIATDNLELTVLNALYGDFQEFWPHVEIGPTRDGFLAVGPKDEVERLQSFLCEYEEKLRSADAVVAVDEGDSNGETWEVAGGSEPVQFYPAKTEMALADSSWNELAAPIDEGPIAVPSGPWVQAPREVEARSSNPIDIEIAVVRTAMTDGELQAWIEAQAEADRSLGDALDELIGDSEQVSDAETWAATTDDGREAVLKAGGRVSSGAPGSDLTGFSATVTPCSRGDGRVTLDVDFDYFPTPSDRLPAPITVAMECRRTVECGAIVRLTSKRDAKAEPNGGVRTIVLLRAVSVD